MAPPVTEQASGAPNVSQLAWKLPFKLYHKTRIGRWLVPPVRQPEPQSVGAIPVETAAPEPTSSGRAGPGSTT